LVEIVFLQLVIALRMVGFMGAGLLVEGVLMEDNMQNLEFGWKQLPLMGILDG